MEVVDAVLNARGQFMDTFSRLRDAINGEDDIQIRRELLGMCSYFEVGLKFHQSSDTQECSRY